MTMYPSRGPTGVSNRAVAALPVAIGVQLYRRHQALAAEGTPEAALTPVEEGSTDPA